MNRFKNYVNGLGRGVRTAVLALAVIFVSAGIAQAATTISTNISTGGTLTVDTTSTLTGAVSMGSTLSVTGATTLASTTATTMKVGQVGTGMTRIVSGYCVTSSTAITATNASSTLTYMNCTPSGGTSIIASGDRVFVQATSSLPYHVIVQAASTTSGGLINVAFTNTSSTTPVAAAIYSLNFWAFQ